MTDSPSTSWREDIGPDEEARFRVIAERIREMRTRSAANDARGRGRSLHTKGHVGAAATLEVRADLPDDLRVSLFATPGPHRCVVRYSNGLGRREGDAMPDVRGLAVKVFDVPGPKLIGGLEHATTQDFLLITPRAFPVGTPEDFIKFIDAAERGPVALLPRLISRFGLGHALTILWAVLTMPRPSSLATTPFHTVVPLRFGAHAGKLMLAPLETGGPGAGGADRYRDDLVRRLAAGPIRYELRIQRFVDEQRTPIEDASVEWSTDVSPWVPLATLTIPRTDLTSDPAKATEAEIEAMSFDPWHATDDLRPLGAMNRIRKLAYGLSSQARGATAEP